MAKCECGKLLIECELTGVDEKTGKLIFKCSCGKITKAYAGG